MARTRPDDGGELFRCHSVIQPLKKLIRIEQSALLEYDEDRLPSSPTRPLSQSSELSLADARAAIQALHESLATRNESTDLFGRLSAISGHWWP